MSQPPDERATDRPEVTTVPPEPPRQRRIPAHLGRARTSTVVLSVLFLAIGALWLNVRPDVEPAPAGGSSDVQQPAAPTSETPTSEVPPTTEPAVPTELEPEPTTTQPTTTDAPAPTAPTVTGDVPTSTTTTVAPPVPPSPSG
jgi:hypothetical protein